MNSLADKIRQTIYYRIVHSTLVSILTHNDTYTSSFSSVHSVYRSVSRGIGIFQQIEANIKLCILI